MKKILVVDDCKAITDVIQLMLKSSGYNCTAVNSASECLSLLRTNRFDLVLLDLAMPEVSGIDVLNIIKKDPALANNRIVFFTASYLTDVQAEDLRKQYGVLDCIRKPVAKAKLIQVIERCLHEVIVVE
jgi:CheY-like chemotaxis protein